jgi:hypothetical protein
VTFTATGFTPGENVALWEIRPGNATASLNSVQADTNGAVSVSVTLDTDGPWQIIAQGQSSGNAAVTPYQATPTGA